MKNLTYRADARSMRTRAQHRRSFTTRMLVAIGVTFMVIYALPASAEANDCSFDPNSRTLSITPTNAINSSGEEQVLAYDACGSAVLNGNDPSRVDVYFTQPVAFYRADVGVSPSSPEPPIVLHAPPGVTDFTLYVELTYPVTSTTNTIPTLRAHATGLDFDDDGNLDLTIDGVPSWNLRKITGRRVAGRLDLREVPMPRGAQLRADLWSGTGSIRFFGPLSGPDVMVNTGNGNDIVNTYGGDDTIQTEGGNDRVFSRGGDDVIGLGRGSDRAWAGAGNDQLYADGTFLRTFRNEHGNDRLFGGPGTNYMRLAGGRDIAIGGPGRDMVSAHAGGYSVNLGGGIDQFEIIDDPRNRESRIPPRRVNCGASRFDFVDPAILANTRLSKGELRARLPRFIGCERRRRLYAGKIAYRFPYSVLATGERKFVCGAQRDWCPSRSRLDRISLTGGWM